MQSLKDALRKTWKTEGLSGLYSGLGSSLLGIVVTNGVYYGFCACFSNLRQSCTDFQTRRPDRSCSDDERRQPRLRKR